MRSKKYSCPNGCNLPPRRKQLCQEDDGTYSYRYHDYLYCPHCRSLMPLTLKSVKNFFEVYHIHPKLKHALNLLYKSEYESSVREAVITLEEVLREKSGLDLHGQDLPSHALDFSNDENVITKSPLISINDLKTESERNEQKGFRLMLIGFFSGPRNIYQHKHIKNEVDGSISLLITVSMFLEVLDGKSFMKGGRWIMEKIDVNEILSKMPKRRDRIRLICELKKRKG